MVTRLLMIGVLLLLAAAPSRAQGPALQQQSFAVWKAEDKCAQEAFRQFPDYTPESNAKRNEAMRRCIEQRQLPPRPDLAPPPRPSSGSSTRR